MNIDFELFLKSLKSDNFIVVWDNNNEKKLLFSGKVYKLYDNDIIKKWEIIALTYRFHNIEILIQEV